MDSLCHGVCTAAGLRLQSTNLAWKLRACPALSSDFCAEGQQQQQRQVFISRTDWSDCLSQVPPVSRDSAVFKSAESLEERQRGMIKVHSGLEVSRRYSLVGFAALFVGVEMGEVTKNSLASNQNIFRRDFLAGFGTLFLGLALEPGESAVATAEAEVRGLVDVDVVVGDFASKVAGWRRAFWLR